MSGKPQSHPGYISPKTTPVDDHFLNRIDHQDKAYVLGMICSDGYLTSRDGGGIGIDLKPGDATHLVKIAEIIGYEGEVKTYRLSRLKFTSWPMREALRGYGLTTRKSHDLPGMEGVVPPSLAHHFVRGLFDGDGSWSYSYEGSKGLESYRRKLTWHLRSTPAMCHYVMSVLPVPASYRFSKTGIVRVKRQADVERVGEWMYQDANLSLERKHRRWIELCPALGNEC